MADPAEGKRLITLFGGAAIQIDGVPIGGRATHRHPLAIIAFLVANGGRPVTRDKLIALLWPERDGDSARNLLKVNVHELRKELGDGAIRSTGDQLSIDPALISCDVSEFLAALAAGDDRRAVNLYVGPFLDGFFLKDAAEFERWCDAERERLSAMYASALDRLATRAAEAGDLSAAVGWRRARAAHEPYHPEVAQRLLEALADAGDRAGAMQFAEAFATRRREDLGISDDHELATLANQITARYTPTSSVARSSAPIISERASDPVSIDSPPAPARRLRPMLLASVIVATGLIVSAWLLTRRAPPVISSIDRVAVMPFQVVGADSALGEASANLFAERLNGDGGAEAIDPNAVLASWRTASLGGRPSLATMLRLGREAGASQIAVGEIVGARDSVAVAARLYGTRDGKLLASARADAASSMSLATVADRVAIELMARAADESSDRIPLLVARPLRAARKYIAAQRAYRSARYAVAERLYAEALDADSTFGAAGLGLAMANSWTVINENYGKGRDAALRYMDDMSVRDRLFANAFFGPDPALGPTQPAPVYLRRWEDLVEKYPDWTEAWYQLGDRYYHFGRLSGLADASDRARDSFRKALTLDSLFAAPLHHLVEIYAARGERSELETAGDRYFAANASVSRDRSAIGWEIATALGDKSWLARVRANFDSMPREELARIVWITDLNGWPSADAERAAKLADRKAGTASEHEHAAITSFGLHLNRAEYQEARVAAAALGSQFPDRPVGALWDLFASLFASGDSALAGAAARQLDEFAHSPISGDHVARDQHHLATCMYGYWQAITGKASAARLMNDRLTAEVKGETNNFARRNGVVCQSMLGATLATFARSPDAPAKVAALDTLLLRERVPPHVILEAGTIAAARLHAALGDTVAALTAARRREHLTGDPLFLAVQLREEAVYSRALGDTAGAGRALRQLTALRP